MAFEGSGAGRAVRNRAKNVNTSKNSSLINVYIHVCLHAVRKPDRSSIAKSRKFEANSFRAHVEGQKYHNTPYQLPLAPTRS